MIDQMVVIFDIDDVLMPWAETVHLTCVERGLTDKPTWTQWAMHNDYGVSLEAWLEVVDSLVVKDGIYHQPPYPGVLEAIDDLWQAGHEIHLVTARGFMAHAQQIRVWTREWVEANHIPGKLWFSQNKDRIAKKISATHGIDDRYKNFEDLRSAGVDAYLQNQPHNLVDPVDDDRRVKNVPEFVERILNG